VQALRRFEPVEVKGGAEPSRDIAGCIQIHAAEITFSAHTADRENGLKRYLARQSTDLAVQQKAAVELIEQVLALIPAHEPRGVAFVGDLVC